MSERRLRFWCEINAVAESQQPGGEEKNRKNSQETPDADATGLHGSNFAIGGEAAQADQNSDQHSGWQSNGEGFRNNQEKQRHGARERRTIADHQLQDLAQLASKNDKGKDTRADQRVRRDFAE